MVEPPITRECMFAPLLEADESFRPRWSAFLEEWADEAELPLYIALHALDDHIQEYLDAGRTESLDAIFSVVERWHLHGDQYVRVAATVGLLEGLQNRLGEKPDKMAALERRLGPESKRWWKRLNRFWQGDTDALAGWADSPSSP